MRSDDTMKPSAKPAKAVRRKKRAVTVSVVVPIYNVAPYLKECLDSVAAQTLKDIEVICIDDGSTDGSGDIADSYVEKDSRFKLVRQKNRGVSAARNKGISLAKGEYIYFIDSDDWMSADALEKLVSIANEMQLDQLMFGTEVVCDDDYTGEVAARNKAGKEIFSISDDTNNNNIILDENKEEEKEYQVNYDDYLQLLNNYKELEKRLSNLEGERVKLENRSKTNKVQNPNEENINDLMYLENKELASKNKIISDLENKKEMLELTNIQNFSVVKLKKYKEYYDKNLEIIKEAMKQN